MVFLYCYYTSDTVAVFTKNTFADESSDSVGHRINVTFLNLTQHKLEIRKGVVNKHDTEDN